ncbi:MAG: hypothetical protein QXW01_03025 [Candidatus Aenigmatarchaeota archaeon]
MIEWIFILLISLIGLYKFNDILVEELEKFAEYSNIGGLTIGFIFLAASCSLPELSISVASSIFEIGNLGIATSIGNIIYDLLLVLGIVAIWYGFKIEEKNYERIKKISLVALISLFPLLFLREYNFVYGLALLVVFIIFGWFLLYEEGKKEKKYYSKGEKMKNKIIIASSLVLVVLFSYLISISSKRIIERTTISAMFLGALVTSFFTSSGELFSCLNAAKRKRYDLIVGTAFGVVFIDSTFVPGIAMLFSSGILEKQFYLLYLFLLISLITILGFAKRKKEIWIQEGLLLLLLFLFYTILNILFIK